jgi:hypothetical protein
MAQSNIDIKILAEFLGKNAFKQADTAVGKLNKSVKSLGASFGIAFGGAALGIAIKKSIRDFADAERETQQLTNTVKNLGLAFAAPEVDAYVEKIGKLYGVTGDQAVPALQALLTATGSVSRSTKIMNVALDLAASRNADVASVASDLANAYVGNTKGLNQYRLGLTKAELAAMSFDEILETIGTQTLGSADEAAKTLSGQLAILAEVSNQAKERIGGGLVQALGGLGGQNGAGGAAKNIENLSIKLTNAITGFGYLVQEIKIAQPILVAAGLAIGLAWAPWLTAIGVAAVAIGAIGNAMRKSTPQQPMNTGKLFFPSGGDGGYKERLAAEKKAEAAAAARAKKLQAMAKASEKAQKDSLKLAKAKAVFDMQKIQIEAALKGKLSEEDAIRLKLMKAIEEENLTNIEKYQKALAVAQEKSKELAEALAKIKNTDTGNPFSKWPDYVKTAIELTNTVAQASLEAGLKAGAKLSEALSGARYAAQGAAAAQAAADAAAIAGAYGSATSSATAAIAAQTKAAQEAAAAQAKASQEAAAAQMATITAGSKAQQEAFAAQLKAQQDALTAQSKAQLEALQQRLSEEAAAYKEAAEAAAAAAMAALDTGASAGVSGSLAKIASEAAAQAAAAAAAEAAATQAAGSVMGGNTTKIEVTVTGDPFTDPNAVAEKVVEIIRSASNRGTVDVLGFE